MENKNLHRETYKKKIKIHSFFYLTSYKTLFIYNKTEINTQYVNKYSWDQLNSFIENVNMINFLSFPIKHPILLANNSNLFSTTSQLSSSR